MGFRLSGLLMYIVTHRTNPSVLAVAYDRIITLIEYDCHVKCVSVDYNYRQWLYLRRGCYYIESTQAINNHADCDESRD